MKPTYDVIVVGSGYGGSITASRMARAGKKVCLLERGKEFQPGEYPDTFEAGSKETQMDTPLGHLGNKMALVDVRVNQEINVVKGCGLGGTSLINANVGMKPEPGVFDDPCWPSALRADRATLQKAYAAAHEMLRTTPYPHTAPMPAKALSMKTGAEAMGLGDKWQYTPIYVNFDIDGPNHVGVDQKPCTGCGDCCSGCNVGAKNTMIMNYLPDARQHGAEIYTQINVRYVGKKGALWTVFFNRLQTGEESFDAPTDSITAGIVVLAGGTLGSTELLLPVGPTGGWRFPACWSEHFTGNGDFPRTLYGYNNDLRANSVGDGTRPADPRRSSGTEYQQPHRPTGSRPTPRAVWSSRGGGAGFYGQRPSPFLVSTAAAIEGIDTGAGFMDACEEEKGTRGRKPLLRGPYHGAVNHTMVYLAMTNDDDRGKMVLDKDRLRIEMAGRGATAAAYTTR